MKQLFILFLIVTVSFTAAQTQTADNYYNQAITAFDNGDYKTTLIKIDNAIKLDSSNVDFFHLKGLSFYELEQYQEAYDTYNKAILIFPNESFLYSYRGNILMSFQEFDYAIQDFTTAMELSGNDSTKYDEITNRAVAKIKKRDFEGAYQDLLKAYAFDSMDIVILTNLGTVCDEIGKGDATLKYLLKSVKIDPTFYPAYGNIGFKYQEMGQYEKAIEYFDKVLEFDPEDPLGYSNRSFNKLKLADLKGAMKDIEKSINIYPENSYAYKIRALIYIEEGRIDKACDDLQAALEKGFTVTYGEEVINLQTKYCKE